MADEIIQEPQLGRMRLPKDTEVFGVVIGTLGGSRLLVSCKDDKERTCRIPGKIKRNIWVRDGDVVLVKPWEIEGDSKGDIIWRYSRLQADFFRRKAYIK